MSKTPERPLDHLDRFHVLRDRFHGLRCAIQGASIANESDRRGLLQLADDLTEDLAVLDGYFGEGCVPGDR